MTKLALASALTLALSSHAYSFDSASGKGRPGQLGRPFY
jgi:hypothetical protein